ncbi:MAG TPA: ABC transporter substrate-binding protein [Nitrospira sp.]|nr:ABC transporter substrate-binding protein [Nitrospira sp.]
MSETVIALVCLLFSTGLASATDVVILKSSDIAAYNQAISGFKAALPNDVVLAEYDLQGDLEKGRKLARKIRAADPALVFAVGLKAAKAAQLEIVDIPVVYAMVLDPAKYELNAPNMTGVLMEIPMDRQLGMVKALLPRLKHVGTLYDPSKTATLIEDARRLLKSNGTELVPIQLSSERDVPGALRTLLPSIDALWLVPDSTVLTDESLRFILNTALDERVPVVGFSREFARSGALLCLSVNYGDIGRQAGQLARKILDGHVSLPAKPLHPDRIELSLNRKTAKFLDIEIPRDIEEKAVEIY